MYKKILIYTLIFVLSMANVIEASAFSAVWDENGSLTINVSADDSTRMSGVMVKSSDDEILYIDQGSGDCEFKTNIEKQTGITISVTDSIKSIIEFAELSRDEKLLYVSADGNDENSGNVNAPLKTLDKALELSDENTVINIVGTVEAQNIISENRCVITGDTIKFSAVSQIKNAELKNITVDATEILLSDGAVIGDGVEFLGVPDIECGESARVWIKDGFFNDITVGSAELHIDENVGLSGKIYNGDDSVIVFENNCSLENYIESESGFIFYLTKGGTVERRDGNINIVPSDRRVFSVNGGVYRKKLSENLKSGIYNISYDYDFRITSLEINKDGEEYEISGKAIAKNLNNDEDKKEIILVTSVYDANKALKQVYVDKTAEKNISFSHSSDKITSTDMIKIFMWDSFGQMIPIANVLQEYTKNAKTPEKTENICEIFVSPDGDDGASGSISEPVKSVSRAQSIARASDKKTVVYLRAGEYIMDKPVMFTPSDDKATYKAYNGEKVVFTAAKKISGAEFKKADSNFKERIINAEAREKILCADISEYFPDDKFFSFISSNEKLNSTLVIDNHKMNYSRFPENEYLRIGEVINDGDGKEPFSVTADGLKDRVTSWSNPDNAILFGYYGNEWSYGGYMGAFDQNGIFTSDEAWVTYAPKKDSRMFAANIPEELNSPGDYYMDFENDLIYIYPYDDFSEDSKVKYTMPDSEGAVIKVNNVQGLTFDGLTFEGLTNAIEINNSKNITVTNCEFTNILGTVIDATKISDCSFINNYTHDISAQGFKISGGKSAQLEYGNNKIQGNKFERFSQDMKTYQPAIEIYGVGNIVSNNEISDSPHMAIGYHGNFNIIEYNEIKNVCNDTDDCGAIYCGHSFLSGGNEVRYNYIHDVTGCEDEFKTVVGVYFDERFSGQKVYSNIFENVTRGVFIGSGRCNDIEKNIFINCPQSVVISRYGRTTSVSPEVPSRYDRELWYSKFPWLKGLKNDNIGAPKYNKINYNAYYNSPEVYFNEWSETFEECEMTNIGNLVLSDTSCFADFNNKDYSINYNSSIFENIPQFNKIDFSKIGIR